jgi:hypothetical protein
VYTYRIYDFDFDETKSFDLLHKTKFTKEKYENIVNECRKKVWDKIRRNTRIIESLKDDEENFVQAINNIKKIDKGRKEFLYEDVDYKNKYTVLIIGSENKDQYMSILKRIGMKVTWFDSYENNVVRLKNMLDRHDIVLCCLKHSRHYATGLMKYMAEKHPDEAIKYNIINDDNLENIIARIRYVIANM